MRNDTGESVSVWAPEATRVELCIEDTRVPMEQDESGYWRATAPADLTSTPYAFSIDGGDPRPDPRSERQPDGVHGPSLRVPHEEFSWSDAGFQQPPLSSAVIYELHVGTFTAGGTLDDAVEHFEDLLSLGVTHVEIMPVAGFSGSRGWGYDGVNLYAPHEAYGGPEALKRFVDAAHRHGLAVLLDVVYNHLGPEGNYLHEFGPYFTERYQTPWGAAVNLDGPGSDEVRRFFVDNALMWLRDYHVDGLRVDAVHAFYDKSAVNFLEQLGNEVKLLEGALGRRLVVIAESDLNDPRIVRSRDAGGYGLDAQWSDDFHHTLHALVTGERWGYYRDYGELSQVAYALERTFAFDGHYQSSRGCSHGRFAGDLAPDRFLGYIQNHDQVGNRARGERLAHLAGERAQQVAAAVYLLAPFVPMIFQGEEWAASSPFLYFTDHQDPALAEGVRRGRKSEFSFQSTEVPDPQAPETARASVLDWAERSEGTHAEMLEWYRALVTLRRAYPELTSGSRHDMAVELEAERGILLMRRGRVVLACNVSETEQEVSLASAEQHRLLLSSDPAAELTDGAVKLPAVSCTVTLSPRR